MVRTLLMRFYYSNYCFILLILFFLAHAWSDYVIMIPTTSVLILWLVISIVAIIYFRVVVFFFGNKQSASLFTTLSFSFFLFFGVIEKTVLLLIGNYSGLFVKGLVVVFLIISFFYFKKKPVKGERTVLFLNLLFSVLLVIELISLSMKFSEKGKFVQQSFLDETYSVSNSERLPSVYLILLDEYAGSETLVKYGFSNNVFLKQLEEQEFKVIKNAKSNYSYTVPSIASLLNGSFMDFSNQYSIYSGDRYRISMQAIYKNKTIKTFSELGYKIQNFSPFAIENAKPFYANRFIPVDIGIILNATIFDDIIDLAPLFFTRYFGSKKVFSDLVYERIKYNYEILDSVIEQSKNRDPLPHFNYIHLMMPHAPYAIDSVGAVNVDFLKKLEVTQADKNEAYLQYLKHTNQVVSSFIKKLKKNTNSEAIILLMSDHGSRDLAKGQKKYSSFNSLNCIYLPKGYSGKWYDSMSNVNQFRILFSTITNTRIPLKQDSIVAY
ncbi:sulfatase-like hydrolase/transferase [Lacibacter sp. H407]|uniref:sulfatase-like hydrolase/transferase n=1 Tax=Lacibacter sp. H407 TaxID=3133423 RepID=UPI0030BC9CCF